MKNKTLTSSKLIAVLLLTATLQSFRSFAQQPTVPPVANFSANTTTAVENEDIELTDLSTNDPLYWHWYLYDVTDPSATGTEMEGINLSNPTIQFATAGVYTVCLVSYNNKGASHMHCNKNFITISEPCSQTQPVAVCQNLTVQLDNSGNATISASQIDNGSYAACGIQSLSVTPNSFDCSDIGSNSVVLAVTDIHNNTSSCSAQVTVNCTQPTLTIAGSYGNLFSYGGNVYNAAGTVVSNITLNATINGQCTGYDLLWSDGASGNNTTVNVSAPSIGTTVYTITASKNGLCSTSASWEVCVHDVSASNGKVQIAHQTGSQSNPCGTRTVSENALQAHLDHGDILGSCGMSYCGSLYKRSLAVNEMSIADGVSLNVYPSPNKGLFTVDLLSTESGELKIFVLDLMGRLVFSQNQPYLKNENLPVNVEINVEGQYLIKVELNGQVFLKRVMVLK